MSVRIDTTARALAYVAVSLLLTWPCLAQGDRGLITGVVADSTGAVVAGTLVRATNVGTGVGTQAATNSQGAYTLGLLLPGTYTLTVEKEGFKRFEQPGVEIRVNDRIGLDIVLEVGAVTESILVEARAGLLESASSSIGTVIDNRRITELPLMHGNPLMLQFLAPGITFNGNPAWTRPFDGTANQSSVHGTQSALEFQLDGAVNTGELKNPAYQPSVEFIQEYKVETAAYDATQGHAAAGWVNVGLKSGTNDFHGSGYYYFQNKDLNANTYSNNLAGQPKAEYAFNRPGATLGGPIAKNRTFFFAGWERIKHNLPYPQLHTVPLPAQKNGDFSQLLALGAAYQIYDPMTTKPAASGRFSRDPFPGNIIPASRISAIGKKVASYYPDPNQAGSADGGSNYNFGQGIEPDRFYSITSRVDHMFNDAHRIFARAVITRRIDGPYRDPFPEVTGNNYISKNRGALLDYVYTINPQTVLNARYGLTRYYVLHDVETQGFDVATLGLPALLRDSVGTKARQFPSFSPSGYSGFLGEVTDGRYYTIHTMAASVSRTQGAHFLRTGVEYRAYSYNTYNWGLASGAFSFGGYLNGPLDNSTSAPRGPGLAGLLLGIPSSGYVDNNDSFAGNNPYLSLHLQDDWKLTRKLTVNLGLRWEYESPGTERYDRSVRGFAFDADSPIAAPARAAYALSPIPEVPASQFNVKGGLTFAGAGGQPRALWNAPKKNFMPRIGFAYSLTPKTVVRAGYGLFFDFMGVTSGWSPIQTGYSQRTQLVPSVDNGMTYRATLANPFPDGILRAAGNSNGLATFLGSGISFFAEDPRTRYNQRWSVAAQRQLGRDWVAELAYVGNRGTALQTSRNLNATPLRFLSPSRVRDQAVIDRLSTQVANPFAGLIPGTGLNSATASVGTLVLPYPHFGSVSMTTNEGYSWYHALESKIEKRFAKGYTVLGSWTWGKNMEAVSFLNAADPRPHEVISDGDRAHRLAINGIYELPFGKGRAFGSGVRGIGGKLIEGWQITAMYQIQSGQPLGLGDFIYYGDAKNIPLSGGERTRERWFNTDNFEKDSRLQLSSNIRYQPLRFSGLRAEGLNYLDFSVIKKTAITERVQFDYRAEFINALNHPVLSPPDTSPTSRSFGMVTAAVALPRTVQFGFVVRF